MWFVVLKKIYINLKTKLYLRNCFIFYAGIQSFQTRTSFIHLGAFNIRPERQFGYVLSIKDVNSGKYGKHKF